MKKLAFHVVAHSFDLTLRKACMPESATIHTTVFIPIT